LEDGGIEDGGLEDGGIEDGGLEDGGLKMEDRRWRIEPGRIGYGGLNIN
jgi:hypothetical protein